MSLEDKLRVLAGEGIGKKQSRSNVSLQRIGTLLNVGSLFQFAHKLILLDIQTSLIQNF